MSEHAAPADPEETRVSSLGNGVDWVSRCHVNEEGTAVGSHTHVSQYLVRASEATFSWTQERGTVRNSWARSKERPTARVSTQCF